jgi:hypothetical protein
LRSARIFVARRFASKSSGDSSTEPFKLRSTFEVPDASEFLFLITFGPSDIDMSSPVRLNWNHPGGNGDADAATAVTTPSASTVWITSAVMTMSANAPGSSKSAAKSLAKAA